MLHGFYTLRGIFFFSSRRRHTRLQGDWSSDVCSSDLTVVTSPTDADNVYIYVSGSAPVRSPNELAGCSAAPPDSNPNSALFRIEVIQVPLAHPEQARIVSSPRIFNDLTQAPSHGETPEDVAAAAKAAAEARATGGFTAARNGVGIVLGPRFGTFRLDSIVKARGGTGAPTAADSAVLRSEERRVGKEC